MYMYPRQQEGLHEHLRLCIEEIKRKIKPTHVSVQTKVLPLTIKL